MKDTAMLCPSPRRREEGERHRSKGGEEQVMSNVFHSVKSLMCTYVGLVCHVCKMAKDQNLIPFSCKAILY